MSLPLALCGRVDWFEPLAGVRRHHQYAPKVLERECSAPDRAWDIDQPKRARVAVPLDRDQPMGRTLTLRGRRKAALAETGHSIGQPLRRVAFRLLHRDLRRMNVGYAQACLYDRTWPIWDRRERRLLGHEL